MKPNGRPLVSAAQLRWADDAVKRILLHNGLLSLSVVAALNLNLVSTAATVPSSSSHQQAARSARLPQNRWEKSYRKAWQYVRDNYYEQTRLNDWGRWEHAFDGKLRNRAELIAAVTEMLDSLKDDYTYLLSDRDKDERSQEAVAHVVHSRMMDGGIGYIKVDNLRADGVVREFGRALKRLSQADAYVLDLRGNHGGYIALANELFSMLTNSGSFMSYSGRSDGNPDNERFELASQGWVVSKNGRMKFKNRLPNLAGDKPLAVLVDADTRSAAELLSGALRENGRATVIGQRTFGKGVLQDAYELGDDLEMKVVTARYFLPDGDSVHEKGLIPDIVATAGQSDAPLDKASDLLRHEQRRRGIARADNGSAVRNF